MLRKTLLTLPIMLTAAAASLGLVPIAPEIFRGPIAYAMIGGIIVVTLVFLPAAAAGSGSTLDSPVLIPS
jgi:multidrug efflux pump subunit AcrB